MIPLRLELRNFMSYGENVTPLDLQGVHVACLSGDNGHGKSALLDAITWALWGEARASSDELIRLGADEMRVVLDFRLGDDLYRIIRGRTRRNGASIWEVYVADGKLTEGADSREHDLSSVTWRPITGQGIRDTGRIIQRLLRMDYRTFINSAYIQQGKADEFTKQSVTDRKKILADILDLSRYDLLEQKAKDRRNEADMRIREIERKIADIDAEIAREEEFRNELEAKRTEQTRLSAEIAQFETQVRDLQLKKAALDAAADRLREVEQHIAEWHKEIENLRSRKAEQEMRIARYRKVIADKDKIVAGVSRLNALKEAVSEMDRRSDVFRDLTMQHEKLKMAIKGEHHKLELSLESWNQELKALQTAITELPVIEKSVSDLKAKILSFDELEARRRTIQSSITELSALMGELKAQRGKLDDSKKDIEEKLTLLSVPGAQCPLCKTELGEDKHQSIVTEYKRQLEETMRAIEAVNARGSQTKSKRQALESELATVESRLREAPEIRQKLAQAEQSLIWAKEACSKEASLREKVSLVKKQLESGDYAHELREKVFGIEQQMAHLDYDEKAHSSMREEMARLQEFESQAAALKVAEENLPADEANLKAILDLISARERSIAESEQAISGLREQLKENEKVSTELEDASHSLQRLREVSERLREEIAVLEHLLEKCSLLKVERQKKDSELERAKKDRAIYADLVTAFGKKGVQALIIENAIPEIQEEANRLLASMTDNAMQVRLETIRDKKTGGTAETLDIKISDDMGTRSYDLYSGGEAFRVNFALRIALSKLLARRAGTRLQTLIIDEGFGTQDGKGREKLVEAIDSIKDDFEKILVITHIDELKDAFPTRIEITKDASGSQINLV